MVYRLLEAQLLKTDSYDSFDLSLQSRLISNVSFLSHSFFRLTFLYLSSHSLLFWSVLFSILYFVREWFLVVWGNFDSASSFDELDF